VIAGDPNVQSVEVVAAVLGDLCDELVLVGGCAASLLIDRPTAPPPRVTYDVDLIAVVATLRNYHALEEQFAERGFTRDVSADAPICRWRIGAIEVDLMPTDETVLGFSNRWYAEAAATAMRLTLPSGTAINLISAPAFLATKFEAFRTRGKADLLLSHDFEDIINVVEGRLSIVEEVGAGGTALRTYLARQFASIITAPDYTNVLPGLVAFDDLHWQRIERVRQRIAALAAMESR
jgi:predicted nucleotidyltransferase